MRRLTIHANTNNRLSLLTTNMLSHILQVEPFPELLRPDQISGRITANKSEFNNAIKDGDLSKAEQIANAILQALLEDTTMDSTNKSKVIN